jgi:Domain of unknown function (DUF4314)
MAKVGDRVRLESCTDEYTRLMAGELGTVTHIDELGTTSVRWDSGSHLGMIEAAGDRITVVG